MAGSPLKRARRMGKEEYLALKAANAPEMLRLQRGGLPEEFTRESSVNRPTLYAADTIDEIMHRLAGGESLNAVCESDPEHFPRVSTLLTWILNDYVPGLFDRYTRARILGAHSMADSVIAIADAALPFEEGVAKIRIDARKWYCGKVLPKIYGSSIDVTSGGEALTIKLSQDDQD